METVSSRFEYAFLVLRLLSFDLPQTPTDPPRSETNTMNPGRAPKLLRGFPLANCLQLLGGLVELLNAVRPDRRLQHRDFRGDVPLRLKAAQSLKPKA